jgi:error-prone DNA polymerase
MTCIREGVTLDEAETLLKPNAEYGLKSPQEIAELYADRPELLAASGEIAESCRFSLSELEYRYPSEKLPEGFSSSEWLRSITMEGARERYRGRIPPDVLRQLERELELIHELGYCGYFLTMWEIVQFCRREKILCQGRGSAANSAVCYCLGITAVDPVRMELLFERFISRERAEPPDIDLDIEHNRREEVIQHMYERYGRDRAAMVANVIRYRRKSAVREVGKVLGISPTAADRVSRLIPHGDGDLAAVLAEAGIDNERYADLLRRLVEEIRDMPRHLSIHPGGFLLGSEPVTSLVPVENATMTDRTVIQWDKYDVEAMNLFKVDLLGLGALSHLRYCFDLLKEHYGKDLAMHRIPAGDQAVFRMLTAADTVGVFQLESRAQMAMLPRLKPRVFYDLVIEVSIVRPGPITGGMVHPYLRRRAGEEAAEYPHPALESVLRKTLGVPLFQEQVMKLAVIAADYSPGEADQLRRDMAAWRRSGAIEKHRETIIERMMAKGIAKEFAERVFDQIRGFGEYGFPESHAASFALIAYCTAWMKTHHHAVFSCALLNAWPMGFYAPSTVVEDAKRHGIQVLPVDVLVSPWMCTIEDGAIRMGLRYVKGLGEADWALVQAGRRAVGESPKGDGREKLRCFVEASSLDEGALDALARAGAFRSLGLERRSSLWEVLGTARRRTQQSAYRDSGETEDFLYLPEDRELSFQALSDFESIGWDYARTGHSTAGHPLSSLRKILTERGFPSAAEVAELRNGSNVGYAGLVICRQRPETAGGTLFMTLEDETGFVNLIIWKRVFADFRSIILTAPFLGVEGKLQTDGDTVHLIVSRCFRPELPRNPAAPASRNFH